MLRRNLIPIMLLLCLFLVLVAPAFAQDVTAEATPAVTATVAPSGGSSPILTPDNAISIVELLRGIIIAVLSGGTLAVILNRFGTNKLNQDVTEKLYQSQSPAAQERERQFFEAVRDISLRLLDFADKVTDGKPNEPLAQLTAMEGPALAKQEDLDMLAKQVILHDKYLHGVSKIENPYLRAEEGQRILEAAKSEPSQ